MLKSLEIQNYALIEHLSIDFDSGLSILTGETGAGKSIIMGALSLILGQRADTKAIQEGKAKCVVEAVFDVKDYGLEELFQLNDVDYDSELIVRREVLDSGKSRAFLNDTPVSLQFLKEVTSKLIDVHSQHANLLLSNDDFQLDVLDSVAQTKELKTEYRKMFETYRSVLKQLKEIRDTALREQEEREYIQFQYAQLSEMKLVQGEQEELERELDMLNHSEEIKRALSFVVDVLDNEQQGVLFSLKDVISNLRKIISYLPVADALQERVDSCKIELQDIENEVMHTLNATDFDPNKKNEIEERLNLIYSLQQKHRVSSVGELLSLQQSFEMRLQAIDSYDEQINALENRLSDVKNQLDLSASALTDKRRSVCEEIERNMECKLQLLGMPNARFVVDLTSKEEFSATGKDDVAFLFSANKNAVPKNLTNIASGGEMSRVMLSLKSLIATKSLLPTIIFDEIDTGVSGEIAHRMGEIMRSMSKTMQVITITHLPQIAAKGDAHYKVYKADTDLATYTHIVRLKDAERPQEIAELLSGKNPSQAALDNAKELLSL
ncbi:MAG: DNA repair protein RecN [Paludibacteraceae bacterium]